MRLMVMSGLISRLHIVLRTSMAAGASSRSIISLKALASKGIPCLHVWPYLQWHRRWRDRRRVCDRHEDGDSPRSRTRGTSLGEKVVRKSLPIRDEVNRELVQDIGVRGIETDKNGNARSPRHRLREYSSSHYFEEML